MNISQLNNNDRSSENQYKNLIENNFTDFNPLKILVRKLLKYKNHKIIHETHKNQNSIHKKQSYENYPEPWLKEDDEYVSEYNNIIKD